MKHNITKIALMFYMLVLYFGYLHAQNYDNYIRELVNQKEWFALEKEYTRLEDSIAAPDLKWVAKTMIGLRFNQSNEAISSIDTLLYNYQSIIGFPNSVELLRYKLYLLDERGEYEYAANELGDFIDQVSPYISQQELREFQFQHSVYNSLRHQNKPTIDKPDSNVIVPFGTMEADFTFNNSDGTTQEVTNTFGIVKTTIQGKEYIFLLDTGYEKSCIFNNVSKDINLHYFSDSINIIGTGIIQGRSAILDSISIGDVTLYNSAVLISDNVLEKYGINGKEIAEGLHGIIGIDFIKRLGEIQIYPNDRKIVIPCEESELPTSGRNIIFDKEYLIVKAFIKEDLTTFHLDTGSSSSNMLKSYYLKNKDVIEREYEKDFSMISGVGSDFKRHTIYKIPSLSLTVDETSFSFEELDVLTENYFLEDPNSDGSLGMDFIRKFNKVTLNLNKMFIQLEK